MESVNVLYVLSFVLLFGSATAESLEFCGTQQVIELTEFGQEIFINSPQYPDPYVTSRNCAVNIDFVLHAAHVVHIEHVVTKCYIPYRVVSLSNDGTPNLCPTCTQMTTGYLQSTDVPHNKDTTNEFMLLLKAGDGDGFNLSVMSYPLLSMKPTDSTVDITTRQTTYITSHQGFPESLYSNNLHNKLTLTDIPSGYVVVIEFVYIRIGQNRNCKIGSFAGDVLIVSKIKEHPVFYECGDIIDNLIPPPPLVINTTDSTSALLLEFITDDSQQFQGFLLRCTAMEPEKHSSYSSSSYSSSSYSSSSYSSSSYSSSSYSSSSYSSSSYSSSSYSSSSYSSTEEMNYDAVTTTESSEIIIAAIGAGSGGILLVVVIVVLACVLYRRSKYRERYTSNTTTENSPPAVDESFTEDERTNDETNRHSTHPYCDVNLPTATERRSGGDNQPPDGGHTEAERGEPDGVDTNAQYTPIVKVEKIEMVENSLYASA